MRKLMNTKAGFTMVELLVVLIIVAVLAAVAVPIYLTNLKRARASEAVATMGLIRQALRDNYLKTNSYFDINTGDIQNLPDASTNPGAGVDVGVAQYFSNNSFSVDSTTPAAGPFANSNPNTPTNFVIYAIGSDSEACAAADTDCAVKYDQVAGYELQMDNSGRIFVSYDNGTTWSAY